VLLMTCTDAIMQLINPTPATCPSSLLLMDCSLVLRTLMCELPPLPWRFCQGYYEMNYYICLLEKKKISVAGVY